MRSSVYTIGWNAVDIRQFPKIGIPYKDTGWLMSRIFRAVEEGVMIGGKQLRWVKRNSLTL